MSKIQEENTDFVFS